MLDGIARWKCVLLTKIDNLNRFIMCFSCYVFKRVSVFIEILNFKPAKRRLIIIFKIEARLINNHKKKEFDNWQFRVGKNGASHVKQGVLYLIYFRNFFFMQSDNKPWRPSMPK